MDVCYADRWCMFLLGKLIALSLLPNVVSSDQCKRAVHTDRERTALRLNQLLRGRGTRKGARSHFFHLI
jgi:hypothetical protein